MPNVITLHDFARLPSDGLTILDVVPHPPLSHDKPSLGYKIKAVFQDAKTRILHRVDLFVSKTNALGISQDTENLAGYYRGIRETIRRYIRPRRAFKNYRAVLQLDGGLEFHRPDGAAMPEHDARLFAYRFH